jgi:hypothetical protein
MDAAELACAIELADATEPAGATELAEAAELSAAGPDKVGLRGPKSSQLPRPCASRRR